MSDLEPRRHLDLAGAYNIRDIGGYPTTNGRRTRWKTLFRADSLHTLTPESQRYLIEYGLRTVIDLRRTPELQTRPNVFANSPNVQYYHQNMLGDVNLAELAVSSSEVSATLDLLKSVEQEPLWEVEGIERRVISYCLWLDVRIRQVGKTLATFAASRALPALYHCASGKDRTGLITALVLGLAGVPSETIAEDYELTGRYLARRDRNEMTSAGATVAEITWQEYAQQICPAAVMVGTLTHLEERYGGIEGYARAAGLTTEQIEMLRHAVIE